VASAGKIRDSDGKSMSSGLGEAGPWAGGIPGFDGVGSPAPATFQKSAPNGLFQEPWFDFVILGLTL
jgi:hypothetical protein